jgi:hypothetical protein
MNISRCFRMTGVGQFFALLLAFIVCGSAHAGFDAKYKAFRGDFNADGNTDLFLTRTADVVTIPLDDLLIPIVRRPADHLVLLQGSAQTFTVDNTLSAAELSTLRTWAPASPVELVANDINVDGQIDLFVRNLKSVTGFPASTNDQIVFYSSDTTGFHVRAVDATFREFFKQIVGWDINHDYFRDTALENHWYHYTGQQQTGWWYIHYINQYYDYDNGLSFLDENDDPTNPNNVPAYCDDHPSSCEYNFSLGYWRVFGTFLANIQVVWETEHFNQQALSFAEAVGGAFDNIDYPGDMPQAESILEGYLQVQVSDFAAHVLNDPLKRPPLPNWLPEPKPRTMPPLPNPANNPDLFPKEKWKWKIFSKVGIVICGLLICSADGESDEWITWRDLGYEWAIDDIRRYNPDESGRIYALVGEGEGYDLPYIRIPRAARAWGAIYLSFGVDPVTGQELPFGASPSDWNPVIERTVWTMNWGWLNAMMGKGAYFYDIGNYAGRQYRAKFYACERRTLQGYPLREERTQGDTLNWTPATCTLQML